MGKRRKRCQRDTGGTDRYEEVKEEEMGQVRGGDDGQDRGGGAKEDEKIMGHRD